MPGKNYSVYVHSDPETGRRYVGITRQSPEKRWQRGLGYVKNKEFYGLVKSRGWDALDHAVIKSGLTHADACKLEEDLIKQYKLQDPVYGINMRAGGFSNRPSDEIKARIAQSLLGHEVSEATRLKLQKNVPGRNVLQLSLDGKQLKKYRSLSEAARSVEGRKPNIWAVLNGTRPTYKGYRWVYSD